MAVGDFGISHGADNADLTVQPLGTVVLATMGYADDNGGVGIRTTDGVRNSQWIKPTDTSWTTRIYANTTEYWYILAGGASKSNVICWVEVA